jgi:hypothetical protein
VTGRQQPARLFRQTQLIDELCDEAAALPELVTGESPKSKHWWARDPALPPARSATEGAAGSRGAACGLLRDALWMDFRAVCSICTICICDVILCLR